MTGSTTFVSRGGNLVVTGSQSLNRWLRPTRLPPALGSRQILRPRLRGSTNSPSRSGSRMTASVHRKACVGPQASLSSSSVSEGSANSFVSRLFTSAGVCGYTHLVFKSAAFPLPPLPENIWGRVRVGVICTPRLSWSRE
jgi:hypothetical protein